MAETKAEIQEDILERLDLSPEYYLGTSGLKTVALERIVEELGGSPWGGRPSLNNQIRELLDLADGLDAKPLRKAELTEVRDAIRETAAADGGGG